MVRIHGVPLRSPGCRRQWGHGRHGRLRNIANSVVGIPVEPYTLRVTHILRRENGEWKIAHGHANLARSRLSGIRRQGAVAEVRGRWCLPLRQRTVFRDSNLVRAPLAERRTRVRLGSCPYRTRTQRSLHDRGDNLGRPKLLGQTRTVILVIERGLLDAAENPATEAGLHQARPVDLEDLARAAHPAEPRGVACPRCAFQIACPSCLRRLGLSAASWQRSGEQSWRLGALLPRLPRF